MNAKKQLHFDFESVRVCYFDIDLARNDSFSNKWESLLASERSERDAI